MIAYYALEERKPKSVKLGKKNSNRNKQSAYISYIELRNERDEICNIFNYGETINVRFGIKADWSFEAVVGIGIRDIHGHQILHYCNKDDNENIYYNQSDDFFELKFLNILNEGEFFVTIWLGDSLMKGLDYVYNCISFKANTVTLGATTLKGLVIQKGSWRTFPITYMG